MQGPKPTKSIGDIAIVGMAGRFPGAGNIDAFWRNLKDGVESITFFTEAELAAAGVSAELLANPAYVRARPMLEDADKFDAEFFGISRREAEVMDPQHRIFLETAWEALEHAGYDPETYPGAIGVYGGLYFDSYLLTNLCTDRERSEGMLDRSHPGSLLTYLGNDKDYLTTRVSYKLNLRGPAVTLLTSCSTSLAAIAQACQSLLCYQCDMALAGGVAILCPPQRGYLSLEGGMVSPDGHCRPFDARGQGTLFGNGCGILLLKRLPDALADGDRIHAVIKGSAMNNDGSGKVSFTAPSIEGQAEVIALAQALAGVNADTISYIEAHGTATPLGDPIEVAALTLAFQQTTNKTGFCGIGSLKSNVGHLDIAAGVAGVIKTALAMQHRLIPPTLHFTTPNPKIDFTNSPFYVVTQPTEWKPAGTPLRAGVSSFGVGGTNAHVVLEEAPAAEPSGPSRPVQLLTLSAKTASALETATVNLVAHFKNATDLNLADAAFTLQVGRRPFPHRRIVAVRDVPEAIKLLETPDAKRVFSQFTTQRDAPVVFLFPGQGAQQINMGAELYEHEPVFREAFDRCARLLPELNLRAAIASKEQLVQTRFTQPALFAIEYALAQLWLSWGVRPTAMIGHSVGEYVAGCLAGVFSVEDAVQVVAERARLVQEQPAGAMVAVRLPENEVQPLLGTALSIAAINAPGLCIVSGPFDAIEAFEQRLKNDGQATIRLQTSHAFHSAMMEPVVAPLAKLLRQVRLSPPQIPYISNVTAQWIADADATNPDYWAGHVRQPVRFAAGVSQLMADPALVLLEVGPGQTLATLARQHPARAKEQQVVASLSLPSELESMLTAFGRLWMAGVTVDFDGFRAGEKRQRIPLPTYPFERKRYWVESNQTPRPITLTSNSNEPTSELKAIETALSQPQVQPTGNAGRLERILSSLKTVLQELSGMDLASIDPAATFMEMGFDSLFLTQASVAFQNKCGVKISFRQLLEDLSTLRDLARFIDEQLPAEAPVATPAPSAPTSVTLPVDADAQSLTERVIAQQLQVMQQQLEMLRKLPGSPTPVAPALPAPAQPKTEPKPHNLFKPPTKGERAELTPRQKEFLEDFIVKYNRRTAESKRLTQLHRARLADPRTVSGFREVWKEIVYPIVAKRSAGSKIWDVDGNEYVDVTMGFGSNMFGHSPAFITTALEEQLKAGIEIGPQSPLAGEVAELYCEMTGHDRVTFCNTGSEAVMAAIRVARTVTGRSKIVYFGGDYHGLLDEVLGRTNSADAQHRVLPLAPGIPRESLANVVMLEYGTPESLEFIRTHGREFAAVLVEPVQSRRPEFLPKEFLFELRRITEEAGTALIFDEMITGMRVHPAGIQGLCGIKADLVTCGKIIGGGMPIGIVAGKREFMDALDGGDWRYGDTSAPEVGVTFLAGTFVRHPLALAAARAVLRHVKEQGPALQEQLNAKMSRLVSELTACFEEARVPIKLAHCASWFVMRLPEGQPDAGLLIPYLRYKGLHTQEYRPWYLTTAHTDADLAKIVQAFRESIAELQAGGFLLPEGGDAGNRDEARRAPVTQVQEGIWITCQMGDEASCAYNQTSGLTTRGTLDLAALRHAVQALVDRHDALRLTFSPDGTTQVFQPKLEIDIPLVDLSVQPSAARDQQVAELLDQEGRVAFDLVHGPLLRAKVIKLEEQLHLFVLTLHHIACDGQSIATVYRDLGALYSARARNVTPTLPQPMQYSEFSRWQAGQQGTPTMAKAEAFWLNQFAKPIPSLDLPGDRPRPPVRTFNGSEERAAIDATLTQDLKRLCAKQNCTLFATLLTGFEILMYRLSGADDLAVGVPASGQTLVNSTDLVGHCMTLLPLRQRLHNDQAASDLMAAVKRTVLDAFDHPNYNFGTLVRKLNVPRDASRTPLVSVLFNVDRTGANLQFGDLAAERTTYSKRFADFDLFFNLSQTSTELQIECIYNSDLFDRATIHRWLGHYRTILRAMAADPGTRVGELPLETPEDLKQLLVDWNATEMDYPKEACLHHLVEAQVAKTPGGIAVICGEQRLLYRDLDAQANRLAQHLSDVGVVPGTLVGIYAERSLDMVVGLLGILKAGGAYVPLDPSFPVERLAFMIEDSRPVALLTQKKLLGSLPPHQTQVVCIDDLPADAKPKTVIQRPKSSDLAYVLYTSGSTGKPKGVQIPHQAVVNFLTSMLRSPGVAPADLLLAVTTLSFDIAGLELYLPLITEAIVVIASRETVTDGTALAQLLETSGANVMQATPATWRLLLAAGWKGNPRLKILCGGEALPADLAEQLRPRCAQLWNMYGPTETTIWSAVCKVELGQPIRIGPPIGNTTFYIVDPQLRPVPIGLPGELLIGGDGLARGYLNRPELTAEKFIANPFQPGTRVYRTGDLVRRGADGTIEFLGRLDHQVKIRGYRIELGEIEAALSHHPAVGEAVVVAREDVPGDQRLVAYLTQANGVQPEVGDLRKLLAATLPEYMVPTAFVVLDRFPLTPNGKVNRKALPAPDQSQVEEPAGFVPPRTAVEEQLAGIWREILRVPAVGVNDNFFAVGGHSLLAVQVVSRVRDLLAVQLPLASFFEQPTISGLAGRVQALRTGNGNSKLSVSDVEGEL